MIAIEKAKQLAIIELANFQNETLVKLSILWDETIEFEYGWIFFYQSEAFTKTKSFADMIGGNAPILIDKYWEIAIPTGIGKDVEEYIKIYSRFRKEW